MCYILVNVCVQKYNALRSKKQQRDFHILQLYSCVAFPFVSKKKGNKKNTKIIQSTTFVSLSSQCSRFSLSSNDAMPFQHAFLCVCMCVGNRKNRAMLVKHTKKHSAIHKNEWTYETKYLICKVQYFIRSHSLANKPFTDQLWMYPMLYDVFSISLPLFKHTHIELLEFSYYSFYNEIMMSYECLCDMQKMIWIVCSTH